MWPSNEQIEELARYRRIMRGGLVWDRRDLLESELSLLFLMNYDMCAHYNLDEPAKQFIGSKQNRTCRYCQGSADTTFKNVSHAVPEAFGNRSLISLDECDRCNKDFSETFEHDFDNFTRPMRTMLRIKGKRVPSFKTKDERARIDYDAKNNRFLIMEKGEQIICTTDEANKSRHYVLPCQSYKPMGVYRCLVKMALAIMPMDELRLFDVARRWILDPALATRSPAREWAKCQAFYSPKPFDNASATLYRRKGRQARVPYALFFLTSTNVVLQIAVPFSPRDDHLNGKIPVPRPDLPLQTKQPDFEWQVQDLQREELETEQFHRFTHTYESVETIDEDEFENPTRLPG